MNENIIGEVAGDIWRYLERTGGRAEMSSVRNAVKGREGVSTEAGLGWLAREGKVFFSTEHGATQIGLKR